MKRYAEDGHLFATPEQAVRLAATIAKADPEKVKELASTAVEYFPKEKIPRVSEEGHEYSDAQIEALEMALNSPVSVLTGGPGSGKTTVLKGVIEAMEKEGKKVLVAAPTGRAAKRASNLTGADATTTHRLLGYRQGEGYHTKAIDADMLIIDEGSMMEQVLFDHLLRALRPGTRVILVGDVDQLPAIGAGDVLRDMIESGSVPVARLSEIFRQGEGSMIAAGAKSINSVEFSDGNRSVYTRSELSELVLAYATTVHKLQGSEVRYMIFPVTMAHKPMLYRNLLYTGVSRARDLCVLVGEEEALRYAVGNTPNSSRNSNFKHRLKG